MAEFFVSLSTYDIATQVARMLNYYNRWATIFSANSLLRTPARYFVEIEHAKVVGCASYVKESTDMSKIQHICVLPNYRQRGVAKKLLNLTIMNIETDWMYMTIREDNYPSIRLAQSFGFVFMNKKWFIDHWTLTFGRRKR